MQQDTSPAEKAVVVAPSDTIPLAIAARALYVGVTGNVAVIPIGQVTPITFVGVQAGTILPIAARIVMNSGTTATNIVALG